MRLFLVLLLLAFAQQTSAQKFSITFYNVENLFDTIDDTLKNDNDFTPAGANKWTEERFKRKCTNIAEAISKCSENNLPDLIGLCEVENRYVLERLISETQLQKAGYEIIHRDSPDSRGIDVALLYKKATFSIICYDFFALPDTIPASREILYTKGIIPSGDTLHVFVNHWPSKRDGAKKTQPYRIAAAKTARYEIDSILHENKQALICLTGDLNDLPQSLPLTQGLGAKPYTAQPNDSSLYNITEHINGTIRYKNKWQTVDQFIVSGSLLKKCLPENVTVCDMEFLTELNTKGNVYPKRTFKGPIYSRGYSDHFPISLFFTY